METPSAGAQNTRGYKNSTEITVYIGNNTR